MCRAIGKIGKVSKIPIQQFYDSIQAFVDFLSECATKWAQKESFLPNVILKFLLKFL